MAKELPNDADREIDSKERSDKLLKMLIKMREEIVKEAQKEIRKFKNGEKKQIVETVLDDGDMSFVDLAEDISLTQLSAHRDKLLKIDEAIRKINEGTYGICEECGDEISVNRLKVIPFATHCRDCQEKKEILEKIKQMEEQSQ
ncbi:MAG: TraR/DksA family transcriptional regulator [Thermodesulfovibrionales bacterium]|nr:TraR/DksA family transcriptional regulator [Thermodesulfovibrionales bacterium]